MLSLWTHPHSIPKSVSEQSVHSLGTGRSFHARRISGSRFGVVVQQRRLRILQSLANCAPANWSLVLAVVAILFLSSGLRFTRILKIGIIIAETRLGVPRTRFGIQDLISDSPARYLYIMQQVTILGGFTAVVLASLILSSYVIFRDTVLETKIGPFSHCYSLAWTCAVPLVVLIKVLLVHVQLIRNRRMKSFFTSLNWDMDSGNGSQSLGMHFGPVRYLARGSARLDRDVDMERMNTNSAIENRAYRAPMTMAHTIISWPSNCRVPSSTRRGSSLELGLMREYPSYFTSASIEALPPDSRLYSVALPESQPPGRSLSASTLRSVRDRMPSQPAEVDSRQGSDQKVSPSVVYGSPQQAFRHLGIFRR